MTSRARRDPDAAAAQAERRREQARAQFEAACDELRSSEGWQRFAKARALLRGYSLNNTMLILAQSRGSHCLPGRDRVQKVYLGPKIGSWSGISLPASSPPPPMDLVGSLSDWGRG